MARSHPSPLRPLPRPFAFPWAKGAIIEEASILREHWACPEPVEWEPTIQLLRYEDGTEALRFCHYQGPRFGRGPLLLSADDLHALAEALTGAPRLALHMRRLATGAEGS